MSPRVTIGLPTYNGSRYLAQALESLLGQDFVDFELIISDNGSEDATQAICQEYAARDQRIRYIRHDENRGAIWNFNKVLQQASGEYFMWAADDDLRAPDYLSACLLYLENDPNVTLAYSPARYIDEEGASLDPAPDFVDTRGLPPSERIVALARGVWSFCLDYGLFRAEAIKKVGWWSRNTSGGDLSMLAELCMYGYFVHVPGERLFKRLAARSADEARARAANPGVRGLPFCSMAAGLIQTVLGLPLTPAEKVWVSLQAAFWLNARFHLWVELAQALERRSRLAAAAGSVGRPLVRRLRALRQGG